MGRRRSARGVKEPGIRLAPLEDAAPASLPATRPIESLAPDPGIRLLDERVRRWMAERARFERHRAEEEKRDSGPVTNP